MHRLQLCKNSSNETLKQTWKIMFNIQGDDMSAKTFEDKIIADFEKLGVTNKLTYRELNEFNKTRDSITGKLNKINYIQVEKPNRLNYYFKNKTDFVILFETGTTGVEIIDSTYFIVHDHILEFYKHDDVCIGVYPVELIKELKIL